jgi:TonB-like protein
VRTLSRPRPGVVRRLVGWLTLLALFFLVVRPPGRVIRPPIGLAAPGDASPAPAGTDSDIADLEMGRAFPLVPRLEIPPDLPPPPAAPETLEPPPPAAAESETSPLDASDLGDAVAQSSGADSSTAAAAPQNPDAALGPGEMALRPHNYVHPRIPKAVSKRKIHDWVVVQPLVGGDGRVVQVRVLRSIPKCDECTESAIAAVEQFVYDAPAGAGGPVQVWTTPVEFLFSYKR